MKFIRSMFILSLVLLLAATPVLAATNTLWDTKTMTAYKGKPTVDGKIDDIWKYATEFKMTYDAQGASAEKLGTAYTGKYTNWGKILWSDKTVYVLVYAQRESVVLDSKFQTWNKDGIELYIDEGNEKSDKAYDANDSLSRILADGTIASSKKKVVVKAGTQAGGYLLEMSYEFESVVPKAGASFGFDLAINYNKDKTDARANCIAWNDRANLAHKFPIYMGTVTFSDNAPPVPVVATTAKATAAAAKPATTAKAAQTADLSVIPLLLASASALTALKLRKKTR